MSAPATRRGFLCGLTTLPLIGGSVALIGSPVRAAQPVTPGMVATYSAWLAYERSSLMHACGIARADDMIPHVNPGSRFHFSRPVDLKTWGLDAVERAPVMLAAAGCDLTDAEAEKTWATTFRPIAWREGGR